MLKDAPIKTNIEDSEQSVKTGSVTPHTNPVQRTATSVTAPAVTQKNKQPIDATQAISFKSTLAQARSAQSERNAQNNTPATPAPTVDRSKYSHTTDWAATTKAMEEKNKEYGDTVYAMFPTLKGDPFAASQLENLGLAERKGVRNLNNHIPTDCIPRVMQLYQNAHHGAKPQYAYQLDMWVEREGIISKKNNNEEWGNYSTEQFNILLDEYENGKIEKQWVQEAEKRAAEAAGVNPTANFNLSEVLSDDKRTQEMVEGVTDYLNGKDPTNADALAFIQKYPENFHLGASESSLNKYAMSAGFMSGATEQNKYDKYADTSTRFDAKTQGYVEQLNDLMRDGVVSTDQYVGYLIQFDQMIDEAERRGITVEELVASDPQTYDYLGNINADIEAYNTAKKEKTIAECKATADTYNSIIAAQTSGQELTLEEELFYGDIVSTDITDAVETDTGYQTAKADLEEYGFARLGEEYDSGYAPGEGFSYAAINGYAYQAISTQAMTYLDDIMKMAVKNGVDFDTMCESLGGTPGEIAQKYFDDALTEYTDLGNQVYDAYQEAFSGYKNLDVSRSFGENVSAAVEAGDIDEKQGKLLTDFYDTNVNDQSTMNSGWMVDNRGMFDAQYAMAAGDWGEKQQEAYKEGTLLSEQEKWGDGNIFQALWLGGKSGFVTHLRSWGETAYFLAREDDATREANWRISYTPQEVRKEIVDTILNDIEDETLQNMLMSQLDNFDGDIYTFNFDFRTAGIQDFLAKKDTTLRLYDAYAKDELSQGLYKSYKGITSGVNSTLYNIESWVLTRGTGKLIGIPFDDMSKGMKNAVGFFANMVTMGASEGAEIGNRVLDAGGSKGEAVGKALLADGVSSAIETWWDGVTSRFLGTGGELDNVDFKNSGFFQRIGEKILEKTGKEGLATLAQFGTSTAANWMFHTATEIPSEIAQEIVEDFFSQIIESGKYVADSIGEIAENTFFSTIFQSTIGNLKQLGSDITSYRRGSNAGNAMLEAMVLEEGSYQDKKESLEAADAAEVASSLYSQDKIDEAVRKVEDSVVLAWKKQKFAAERVAVGMETELVQSGLAAEEQRLAQELETANAIASEATAKAEEAAATMDEMGRELRAASTQEEIDDALNRYNIAMQTAVTAQENADEANAKAAGAKAAHDTAMKQCNDVVARLSQEATAAAEAEFSDEAVNVAAEQLKQQKLDELTKHHELRMREIFDTSTSAVDAKGNKIMPDWFATKATDLFNKFGDKVLKDYAATKAALQSEIGDMVSNTFRGWNVQFSKAEGQEGAVDFEGKTVYLDPDATPGELLNGLVAHEIAHLAERSGNWDTLVNAVKEAIYTGEDGETRFEADIDSIIKNRAENGIQIGRIGAVRELVADLVARNILPGNASNALAEVHTSDVNWMEYLKNGNKAFAEDIFKWLERRADNMRKMSPEYGDAASRYADLVDLFRTTLEGAKTNLENGISPQNEEVQQEETTAEQTDNATINSAVNTTDGGTETAEVTGEGGIVEPSESNTAESAQESTPATAESEWDYEAQPQTIEDDDALVDALRQGNTNVRSTEKLLPMYFDDDGVLTLPDNASPKNKEIADKIFAIKDLGELTDAVDAYNIVANEGVTDAEAVVNDFMRDTAETNAEALADNGGENVDWDALLEDDTEFSPNTYKGNSAMEGIADLLNFALRQASESGDIKAYNSTVGKIYGITARNRYKYGSAVNSPVNIVRLLATETGGNLYEGGGVGVKTYINTATGDTFTDRHLTEYDGKSRAIVSDRVNATNFAAIMLDVARNVEAKIPDFHSGVFKSDGTEMGLQDFFFDYMTTRDSTIANNPALASLGREVAAFREAMSKDNKAMLDAIEHRREQLCKLTDEALVAQTYKVRVQSMLRSKADARSAKEKKSGVLRKIYADVVDRSVYASWLDNISNKINGTSGKDYTKTMQIGETSEAYLRRRAQTWIDGACADMDGNATGYQSATDIMHKHKVKRNQYSVLNDYLMAKEALDRYELYEGELAEIESKGEKREPIHKPPFGTDEENEVFFFNNLSLAPTKQDLIDFIADVEANNKNVADACADLYEWWDGFMRSVAVAEGLITQDDYDRMHDEHPHYAPLRRKDGAYKFTFADGGSTEQVTNPFEEMLSMQTQFVNSAARNRTYRAFDTVYNNTPGLGIIASKIEKTELLNGDRTQPTNGNTITVHRADGTTAYYIIKDKQLLDMMNNSGNEIQLKGFIKVLGSVTRNMAKLTTGVNMLFAAKNATRDFQHSVTYGSWASNYFTGFFKWLAASADVWRYAFTGKSTQQMEDFANLGGYGYERFDVGQKKSFNKLKRGIFVNNSTAGKVVSKTLSGFMNFIEAKTLNEVIETTSRYAEYKYGKIDTSSTATAEQKLEAFMNSREATVDFERHGSGLTAKLIRQFVPFINASTQGVAQSIRAVVDPAERSRLAPRVAKVAFNYAVTGALSAMLMLKFNGGKDDDEKRRIAQAYIDEADELKQQFILIPGFGLDGARDCWRLPVGQDMWGRMFYEFGRKGAEMYFTKADGYEDLVSNGFLADVLDVLIDSSFGTFTEATTIFSPINEVLRNENYYNTPIVSEKLQEQNYLNQFSDSTSDAYIIAARMANAVLNIFNAGDNWRKVLTSPVNLQYWTSQYTGLLGQIIPAMFSKDKFTGEVTPVKGLGKLVKNSFTLDLDTGADIEDTVDGLQQYMEEIAAASDAHKDYYGLLDPFLSADEMTDAVAQAKAYTQKNGYFDNLKKEKNALWSVYYDIMGDTTLSDAEKENRVEKEVYAPMLELNKKALRELAPFEAKYKSGTWAELKAATRVDATMPSPARSQVNGTSFTGKFADDWSNGAAYMTEFAGVYDQSTGSTTMPYTAGLKSFDILGVNYEPDADDLAAMEDEYYKYYSDAANKLVASKEWQTYTLEEKQKEQKDIHSKAYAAAKKWYTDKYKIKTKK